VPFGAEDPPGPSAPLSFLGMLAGMTVRAAAVWLLLGVLCSGCASGPVVRLRTEDGGRVHAPVTVDRRVGLSRAEFEDALVRLVLDSPLTVRPARGVRTVALLEDGAGFGELDRLRWAVGLSLEPLRRSIGAALREVVNPQLFFHLLVGAMTTWVALASAPEPVFTKVAAYVAALVLVYVGVQSLLTVVRACGELKDATDRATTLQELEVAAEVFAERLGPEVARIFVLAVTVAVSHGVTMGMTSTLSALPRFPPGGLSPAQVLEVRAVAVVGLDVEVTLASSALAVKAVGLPPPGGPGKWVQVNESMSDRAREYQAEVTGAPKGSAYRVRRGDEEVDFDGYDPKEDLLLEAKGPGYEQFLDETLDFKTFFNGENPLFEQARRQVRLAQGTPIRWIVAEERFALKLREVFRNRGVRIKVVWRAPNPK
jgi:hypothetical protein